MASATEIYCTVLEAGKSKIKVRFSSGQQGWFLLRPRSSWLADGHSLAASSHGPWACGSRCLSVSRSLLLIGTPVIVLGLTLMASFSLSHLLKESL